MNFTEYMNEEVKSTNPMNESTVSLGKTDRWKGDKVCGAHHHDYILWDPHTGWGKTGDALEDFKKNNHPVATHEHMIVDGKVLEAAGHTHELLAPTQTGDLNSMPDQAVAVKEVE